MCLALLVFMFKPKLNQSMSVVFYLFIYFHDLLLLLVNILKNLENEY